MKMPVIDISAIELDELEYSLIQRILGRENRLRSVKPEIDYSIVTIEKRYGEIVHQKRIRQPDYEGGCAAYLWRMVAFSVSPISQHKCFPATAHFDLPGESEDDRRILAKEMDKLADKIVNSVKVTEWHGVQRWDGIL